MMASRPLLSNNLKTVISFEIISSTEWNFESQFSPNYFEKLTEKNISDKIKTLLL